ELLVDWADAFEKANSVITSRMDDTGKATLFRAIRFINKENRPVIIELSIPLFTEKMGATGRADILKAQYECVFDSSEASPVITEKMTGESRAVIIRTFHKIAKDDRQDVREEAIPFLTQEMDGPRVAAISEAIHATGEERQEVLAASRLLLGKKLHQIDGYEIATTIRGVLEVKNQWVRRESIALAESFYSACNATTHEKLAIFKAVTKINGDKTSITANTNRLVVPGMNGAGIIKLLAAVDKCGAQAQLVTDWVISFLNEGMRSVCDRETIVNTVRDIVLQYFNWKQIFEIAQSKMSDTMGSSDIAKILKEEAAKIGCYYLKDNVESIVDGMEKIAI
ncbi:MAG: hypothetical protein JSR46_09535, partial [Verrucomicrobia bacterium]|nr:hypothetical protein [Verrucomicrobiota bacterium]